MADFSNLQTASWRPRRREPLFDGQVKLIGLTAAGLIGVAVLGYGGYALLGSRPHVVPVVEADPRPLRVRPDNPGGMQVVGAEELAGAGNSQVAMAPPPEVPAPQALRAKIKAETQSQAQPQAQPQPAAATQPAAMVSPPVRPPVPDYPTTAVKPASPAKPQVAPAPGAQVQLAAFGSERAAMTEWQLLSHRMPELLSARQPAVQRAERDGKVIFRLRTGGFADQAAATAFCQQVRLKGAGCSIASF